MNTIASQITSLTIVYLTVNSGTYQRKHQSSAALAFVRGIHRGPVNSPHKWPVTRKMFPFDDVIMWTWTLWRSPEPGDGSDSVTGFIYIIMISRLLTGVLIYNCSAAKINPDIFRNNNVICRAVMYITGLDNEDGTSIMIQRTCK